MQPLDGAGAGAGDRAGAGAGAGGTVLRARRGLAESDLRAIADLQNRVVEADGGRLKLEWQELWTRPDTQVNDFCVDADGELIGFLGIYGHGGDAPELAGMVDPRHRRRGIGTRLLDAACTELASRDVTEALLVCPRSRAVGSAFAHARGGVAEHSEFALELHGQPAEGPSSALTALRPATAADGASIRAILRDGFGFDDASISARLNTEADHLVIVVEEQVVGYLRLTFDDADREGPAVGGVYGFAIDAAYRGKGIGRDVLRRCCLDLIGRGAQRVGLEVATDNEHALGLYTSLGFEPVATEDYFRIETSHA